MQRLTAAHNLMLATLWQAQLQSAGIACEVRNVYLGAGAGELPPDLVQPEIWLIDGNDYARAAQLLAELREPRGLAPWCCFNCGERIEGQFAQCWNCQHARPARD